MPRGSPTEAIISFNPRCIFACHRSKMNPRIHSFSIAFPPITKEISVIRNNNFCFHRCFQFSSFFHFFSAG